MPETARTVTTDRCVTIVKKAVKETKEVWRCPECGAAAEPDSLCEHCGEPYTRLWGYGFTRCWKTADGIEWETETAPACGCMPGEAGQLENVDSCNSDNNSCGTVDNVDDVAEM